MLLKSNYIIIISKMYLSKVKIMQNGFFKVLWTLNFILILKEELALHLLILNSKRL